MDAFDNPAKGGMGSPRHDDAGQDQANRAVGGSDLLKASAAVTAAASAIPLAIQGVLVPDASGRIVLPAGVSIDDITVSGADLVITLPNGDVLIVPNGAVNIPAIVVGGDTVPASTVAQLLENLDELNPEAAAVRSSGGNFADPEGAIQDPYALGDLLPYTELAFPEPRDEDIIPAVPDDEPEVVIVTPDQPIGVTNATASVNEAGLPARGNEPAGSNSGANSETTTGSIAYDATDGLSSITINGTAVTGVGQVITTPLGQLTITSVADGSIGYSYSLTDNTNANANPTDVLTVVVTDSDGDTATADLTISVVDDAPIARNDTDQILSGDPAPQTGNVLTGAGTTSGSAGADTPGADGATLTGIRGANGEGFSAPGTVQGQYGTLTINADGSYSYVRNPGTPGGVSDVFTYRIADSDGDISTATLTISIQDSGVSPVIGDGDISVSEAGLAAREGESAGSDSAADSETGGNSISFIAPDGIGSVTIAGTTITPGNTPQVVSSDATGTLTVTSYTIDAATGLGTVTYSYTLADNTLTDPTALPFTLVATDVDGDSLAIDFTVTIVDDTPTARDDADSVSEDGAAIADGNVLTGSGGQDENATDGVADTQGADGATVTAVSGGTIGESFATAYGSLTLNADGSYTYVLNNEAQVVQGLSADETLTEVFTYTLTDGDGDTSIATLTITINGSDDGVTIDGLNAEGAELTVDEDDLADGSSPDADALTQTNSFSVSAPDGLDNVTIGGLQVVSGGVFTAGSATSPLGTLTITGFTPVTGAGGSVIGGTFTYEYVLADNTLTHTLPGEDNVIDSFPVIVTDSDGSTGNTSLDVAIIDDQPDASDDSAGAIEDTPVVIDVLFNDTRGADSVNLATSVALGTAPTKGSVVYNGDGTFTYTPTAGAEGDDSFTYTITDGDGDTSTATVTITLSDDSIPTIEVVPATPNLDGNNEVDEAGLNAGGSDAASNSETTTGTLAIATGNDTVQSLVINNVDVTAGGTVTTTTGVLTVTLNEGVYSYSYTLTTNTSGDDTFDSFDVVVTDSDGDTASDTLIVDIVDDVPTARPDVDSVTEDGPLVADGNVLAGSDGEDANLTDGVADTPGADGATVTAVTGGVIGEGFPTAYGMLTLNADGSYRYVLNSQAQPVQGLSAGETLTETFKYTLTDGDGDIAEATLTITINGSNDGVTINGLNAEGAELSVDEDDLPARAGESAGSDGTGSLTDSDSFSVNTPDGMGTVVIDRFNGVALGEPLTLVIANGNFTPQSVTTAYGKLTITGFAEQLGADGSVIGGTFTYSYTLTDNRTDHPALGQDNRTDSIGITVTDSDGSSASAEIDVRITDDVPTARDDSAGAQEDIAVVIDVLFNDTRGADGIDLATGVAVGTPPTKGTVTYDPVDGTFTYTPTPGQQGEDSFTYTITDGDGDTSTATVTITLSNDSAPQIGTVVNATVDEDGLPGANVDGSPLLPGEFDSTESATGSGSITVEFGNDVPSTLAGSIILNDSAALDNQLTVNNVAVTFAKVGNDLVGSVAGNEVIRISLTTAVAGPGATEVTYGYTVTLSQAIDQAVPGSEDSDVLSGIGFTVTDDDGTQSSGSFGVTIVDDLPTLNISDAPNSVVEGATVNGSWALDAGADGVSSVTVTFGGGSAVLALTTGSSVTIAQPTGTLTVNANGTFSFAANGNQNDAGNPSATFSISALDRDLDPTSDSLTIAITDGANPANATPITLTVNEAALDNGGSTPGSTNEVASGTLSFTAGSDTLSGFAFTGVAGLVTTLDGTGPDIFWTQTNAQTIVGSLTSGGPAAITISLTAPASIAPGATASATVTVTLADNVPHALAMAAQTQALGTVTVQGTDTDGDPATGVVTVQVTDDVPAATAEPGQNVAEGATVTGTLDFTPGADGASITHIDGTPLAFGPDGFSQAIDIGAGSIKVKADGSYSFTADASVTGTGAASAVFTVTDGDGDTATAPISFTITDANTPTAGTTLASVDDDALTGGNPNSTTGDLPDANLDGDNDQATFSGTLNLSFGGDGPGSVNFAAMHNLFVNVGQESAQLTWNAGTNTLTATTTRGALFTVQVTNPATGAYKVTLLDNVIHNAGDNENDATVTLGFTVVDSDGSTAPGTLQITFDDDAPTVVASTNQPTLTVDETVLATNASASFASVFTAAFGADDQSMTSPTSYVLGVGAGATGLIDTATGLTVVLSVNAGVVEGRAGASGDLVFTVSVAANGTVTLDQIRAVRHDNASDPNDTKSLATDDLITLTATVTDGDGDTASATTSIGQNLVFRDDGPIAVDDSDSIAASSFGPATGNVITDNAPGDAGDADNGADTRGADGAAISAIASVNVPLNSDITPDGLGNFQVNGQYGVLTINADGSYSYTRNAGAPGGVNDVFDYTLRDGDGDTDIGRLTISIADSAPITGTNATVLLDDDAVAGAGGNAGGTGDDPDSVNATGTLAGSGGDGALTFALNATGTPPAGFTYEMSGGNLLVKQGAVTVLTVTVNPTSGAYTVTQNAPIKHATGGDENNQSFTINYSVSDADSDSAPGSLTINVDDDTPTVVANATQPTLSVDETILATNASTSFASAFTASFGADGQAASNATSYALGVGAGSTGLIDTASNLAVVLSVNGSGVVEGRAGDGGALVFTVSVAANGTVTLDQIRAVRHDNASDPDDPKSLLNDNLVTLTATITDGDGDTVSATANIGQNLVFEDDGPSVTATAAGAIFVTNDETATTSQASTITFAGIAKGNDPDVANAGAISVATSASAMVTASPLYGADGQAAANPLTYALTVTNAASGLTITDGSAISLVNVGGVIVGVVGGSGTFAGQAAFAIEINSTTGIVRVEQYLSLGHPTATDPDDQVSLLAGRLGVTATATDRDGDTATSNTVDISGQIRFDDDGPSITNVAGGASVTLDETGGFDTVTSISSVISATFAYGADGPATTGALVYGIELTGGGSSVASGLRTTVGDFPITLVETSATTIVGRFNNGSGNQDAFTISIGSDGRLTVTQLVALDHPLGGAAHDDTLTLDQLISATVMLKDGDNDTAPARTEIGDQIIFRDDGPSISVGAPLPSLTVDESNLAVNATSIATFTSSFGADGPGAITYALGIAGPTSGLVDTATGQAVVLSLNAGVVEGRAGTNGPIVFTLSVNSSGTLTLDQQRAIAHDVDGGPGASHDDGKTLSLANMVTLTATITDGDNDSASATINLGDKLTFKDDGPTLTADSGTTTEATVDFNAAFVIDFSGSIDSGELDILLDAVREAGLLLFGNSTGNVSIRLVGFSSTAEDLGVYSDPVAFVRAIDDLNADRPFNGGTDFTAGIEKLMDVYVPSTTASNQVFFLSDGNPNEQTGSNGNSLANTTRADWINFVNSGDVNVTAIGVGNGISIPRLQDVNVDGGPAPIVVADFETLVATLLDVVVALPISGNLSSNDNYGADGGRIQSILVNGTTYTWDGATTITRTGANPGTEPAGTSMSATTPNGATLTLNFATGAWSYAPPSNPTAGSEIFNYSVIDRDGDTASSTLTVTVVESAGSGGNIANGDLVFTNATGANAAIQIAEAALLANDQAGTTITGLPTNVTDANSVTRGGGNFTFTDNDGDGGRFYYSTSPSDSARVTVNRDQAGSATLNGTSAGEILIGRDTDADTINGGDGKDYLYGLGGNDVLNGGADADVMFGGAGNDTFNLANGNFAAGEVIDGGADNDTILLTNPTTVNFSTGSIINVESLTGSGNGDNVTISTQQWDALTTIDLAGGNDVLNVQIVGAATITTATLATIANVETFNFRGSDGNDTLTLAGAELDNLLTSNGLIDLGGGTDTLSLTSTSSDLNALADGNLLNVETVSAASAAAGVTINLGNQTEAMTIIGSASGDTITASTGVNSIVNAGAGADRVTINAAALTTRNWTVDLGADSVADKIVFTHNGVALSDNTLVTVNNFSVANDRIAVSVNGTGFTDGSFQSITANSTNVSAGVEVIEIAIGSATLGDDANGGSVEALIQAATNNFASTGTYTVIAYSSTDASANAGIYSVTISNTSNPGNNQMVVEHIMTINGVGHGNLTLNNFVGAGDPIVFDLTDDGYSFGATAEFDINADGTADRVTWNSSNDGILAVDLDGNGMIDSGREIFTPGFAGGSFASGVAALAALDDNGDGVIDANDAAFAKLLIWQDANADGVSDAGELSSLADQGIASIATGAAHADESIDGQDVTARGSFTRTDGSTGGYIEVQLDTQLGARREADDVQRSVSHQAIANAMVAASLVGLAQGAQADEPKFAAKTTPEDAAPAAANDEGTSSAKVGEPVEPTAGLNDEASDTSAATDASHAASASHLDAAVPASTSIDAGSDSDWRSDDQADTGTASSDALFDLAAAPASPMDGLLTLGLDAAAAATATGEAAAKDPAAEAVLAEVLDDGGVDRLIDGVTGEASQHATNADAPAIDLAQFLNAKVAADMGAFIHQPIEHDLNQMAAQA